MKIPSFAELRRSPGQLTVYQVPVNEDCFAVGPPGTGKTVLAALRARRAAEQGQSVLFLTYGRLLRRYAALFGQLQHPRIDVTTYFTWLGRYWDRHFHERIPQLQRYQWIWHDILGRLGTYAQARQYDHVIVDEGQDVPPELYIVLRHVGTYLTVFADEKQTITMSRSSLQEIHINGRLPYPIMLDTNFRNTPEIAHLAHSFHQGDRRVPLPRLERRSLGHTPQLMRYDNEAEAIRRISNRAANNAESIGVLLPWQDTIARFRGALRTELGDHVRVQYYSGEEKNDEDIVLDQPAVTLLTPLSAKGLEFETVFACALEECWPLAENLLYVICSRPRSYLFLMYSGPHRSDIDSGLPQPPVLRR